MRGVAVLTGVPFRDGAAPLQAKPGFGAAVARLQTPHAGITARVVPYTNGRIWDSSGPLGQGAVPAKAVCKGRNGDVPLHPHV